VQGRDPLEEQRKAKASAQNTLRAVCENFLIREGGAKRDADGNLTFEGCTGKLRTAAERHATFERHVYPRLGKLPIEEIKRSDINALLDKMKTKAGRRWPITRSRTSVAFSIGTLVGLTIFDPRLCAAWRAVAPRTSGIAFYPMTNCGRSGALL
jgi:hypothetical protein